MTCKTTLTISLDIEVPNETMGDLLDDCIAGINYWAAMVNGRDCDDGDNTTRLAFEMIEDASEVEFPEGMRFALSGDMWLIGLQRALKEGYTFSSGIPSFNPDEWDFDAFDHDLIVQLALFDEIIFG